jgi:hypothetical protein
MDLRRPPAPPGPTKVRIAVNLTELRDHNLSATADQAISTPGSRCPWGTEIFAYLMKSDLKTSI